jgi:hypothetical protein
MTITGNTTNLTRHLERCTNNSDWVSFLERKTKANNQNLIETRVEKNELIINTPIKTKDGVDKKILCRYFYI